MSNISPAETTRCRLVAALLLWHTLPMNERLNFWNKIRASGRTLTRILINVTSRRNNLLFSFFFFLPLYYRAVQLRRADRKPRGFSAPWFRPRLRDASKCVHRSYARELNAPVCRSCNLTGQCFRKIDLPVTCGSMSPATWCHIGCHRQFITGLPKTFLPRQNLLCSSRAFRCFVFVFSFFSLSPSLKRDSFET